MTVSGNPVLKEEREAGVDRVEREHATHANSRVSRKENPLMHSVPSYGKTRVSRSRDRRRLQHENEGRLKMKRLTPQAGDEVRITLRTWEAAFNCTVEKVEGSRAYVSYETPKNPARRSSWQKLYHLEVIERRGWLEQYVNDRMSDDVG